MTIRHHPSEALLTAYASGALSAAESLVVAVHANQCANCRRLIRAVEGIGGASLEETEPASLGIDAFERITSMLRSSADKSYLNESETLTNDGLEDLPAPIPTQRFGRRRWVAPGVRLRTILLPGESRSRAFLLYSRAGARMIEHSHSGVELTCVLKGSFSHKGGRYGPGDFDFGDYSVDHQPVVGPEEPCLCIVAMQGRLRVPGFLGRLISPFIHV
jgi:putative transcriptional regulator